PVLLAEIVVVAQRLGARRVSAVDEEVHPGGCVEGCRAGADAVSPTSSLRFDGLDDLVIPAPSWSAHPSRASMARVVRSVATGRRIRVRACLDIRPPHMARASRPSLVQRDPNAHGRGAGYQSDPTRHARRLAQLPAPADAC